MNKKEKISNLITKAINQGCKELLIEELVEAITKDWTKEEIEVLIEGLDLKKELV